MASKLEFLGKGDGPSIEEYIKYWKGKYPITWTICIMKHLVDDSWIWGASLNLDNMLALTNEIYEHVFLDR